MPRITTKDGTSLYYKDWGEGCPVIMIHGWPLSADSWDDISVALVEGGYRVIAYDRRGFGRSDQPWDGYDYDTFSDDLKAVIAETGANNASLVGFSMGGGEVARYLSRHGASGIKSVALIASVVPYMLKTADNPNGVDQDVFDGMTAEMKKDRAAFFTGFFKDFYGNGWISKPVSTEVLEDSARIAMTAGLRPTLAAAGAFASTDFRPDLASFTVPTLVIHGTADKTVPIDATAREVAKKVPTSTLVEYEGAAHGLLASDKDRVIAHLLEFLATDTIEEPLPAPEAVPVFT